MKIYFAYGSNLNRQQMKRRAPSAKPLCKLQVLDWRLVFRHVADIAPAPGDIVNGALYLIDEAAERELDLFEGVEAGTYRKVMLPIDLSVSGRHFSEMLTYVMNSTGIMPPTAEYLSRIREGYHDWGLPIGPLTKAVEASHDDKAPSHIERARYRRTGRPTLAARPSKKVARQIAKGKPRPIAKASKPAHRTATQLDLGLWRKAMTVYGD